MIRLKGVYVLIFQISQDTCACIGALGNLTFEKGLYAYVGSSQNNLQKRIDRHFSKEKSLFWHIDYLLVNDNVKIQKVLYKEAEKTLECQIAKSLSEKEKSIDGFGCSDCHCISHLFRISGYSFLEEFMQVLHG